MNCVITVKGDGRGLYGKPKNTRTGPLSEFLVNNQVFFSVVKKHLRTCSTCSVDAVLKVYLHRLTTHARLNGASSTSLTKYVLSLENIAAKKGETLTPGLVNEFLWRGGPHAVKEHGALLSTMEKLRAFSHPSWEHTLHSQLSNFSGLELQLVRLAIDKVGLGLSDQEIEDMCSVAEVMCT